MNDQAESDRRQARLDLLVDGELDPCEVRHLIEELDAQPGGWKRCALAFLEAQAWQQELSGVAVESRSEAARPVEVRRHGGQRTAIVVLAVVASFLLPFALVPLISQIRSLISEQPSARGSAEMATDEIGSERLTPEAGALVTKSQETPPQNVADETALGHVTLVMQKGDGEEELELPVYPLTDAKHAFDVEDLVPADVRQAFQRLGYEMRPSVEWTPLEVDDERRLYVPTGQVQFTPTTYRTSY